MARRYTYLPGFIGCYVTPTDAGLMPALTGMVSDNLWQFDDDTRPMVERWLTMACELSGLIQDVSDIKMLISTMASTYWRELGGDILPAPFGDLERGAGDPPGTYSGGTWEDYDLGVCRSAFSIVDQQREVIEQVLDIALYGTALTLDVVLSVMGFLCPPLILAAQFLSGLLVFIGENEADDILDAMDNSRDDLVCIIYNSPTPAYAKNAIDDYFLENFSPDYWWLRHVWSSDILNDILLGDYMETSYAGSDCSNCGEPPVLTDEANWEFVADEEGWLFNSQSSYGAGVWTDDPGRLRVELGGSFLYEWAYYQVDTEYLDLYVTENTAINFRARCLFGGGGLGGDGYVRVFLQHGTETTQATFNMPHTGEWSETFSMLSDYQGYRINAIRLYLRQRSSWLELDYLRIIDATPELLQEWTFDSGSEFWQGGQDAQCTQCSWAWDPDGGLLMMKLGGDGDYVDSSLTLPEPLTSPGGGITTEATIVNKIAESATVTMELALNGIVQEQSTQILGPLETVALVLKTPGGVDRNRLTVRVSDASAWEVLLDNVAIFTP